jgi:hypothetical protein
MHEVVFLDKTKNVASTWDELSREQCRLLLPILYGKYTDANQQRIEILEVLLGVSRPLILRLTSVHLIQIFWLTDFLLKEPVTRTRQLLPTVKPGRLSPLYYGPADELTNISFLEFAFADAYFVAYANTGEAEWLDQLVATLYRRPRRMAEGLAVGDRRLPFNENLIEAEASRLARLPKLSKLAIATFYRGCRHALEQRYPHVFTLANQEQAKGHPDGWAYVLREMSGQAFGNYAETGRQLAHQVLAKMNDDLARAEELRRQHEAQQRQNA